MNEQTKKYNGGMKPANGNQICLSRVRNITRRIINHVVITKIKALYCQLHTALPISSYEAVMGLLLIILLEIGGGVRRWSMILIYVSPEYIACIFN